jgi:hypothetical protein
MTKRIKKPAVKPELRRMWLRRNEEEGESPPQIAAKDGYDVRTVRKQIEMAKQEREAREARSIVLRNALEEHYRDLCKYAEFLNNSIGSEGRVSVEGGLLSPTVDIMHMNMALRQHLTRSPLWKDLNKLSQLNDKLAEVDVNMKQRISDEIERDFRLGELSATGEGQVVDGIIEVLTFQAKAWAQGQKGLNINDNFKVKPAGEGWVSIDYGFSHMGEVPENRTQDIKDLLTDFEQRIVDWEQLDNMRRLFTEIGRVQSSLREELAVIIHRRIVPGKCKYCPL